MYFVTGEIHGGIQNVRYKGYEMAVSVAKRLRGGVVKNSDDVIVFPKAVTSTPRWIQNPRYWNEEVRTLKKLEGVIDEEDYRASKRANYLTFTDILMDVASVEWTKVNGQIPSNYWIRHKIGKAGFRDVTDNRIENLEMTLARNFYDYRIEVNVMPKGAIPLPQTKLREWFHYDEETGVLFARKPYISVYGVRDASNRRPVVRVKGGGCYYDIATSCYIYMHGPLPPLVYVGFKNMDPNNLSIDNLGLFPCDYGVVELRRDYEFKEGEIWLKVMGIKVPRGTLTVPGARLSQTVARALLA